MFTIDMQIEERNETIRLLDGLEALSILHISDIHLWFSTKILETLTGLISKNDPDIIVLTGDYYDIPRGAYNFRRFLMQISEDYQIVFIRGNHDTLFGSKVSNIILDIPNCICVEDLIFKYRSKRGYLYNITEWTNRNNLPNRKGEVNIVLIHNPEKIRATELSNIDLILAGHLHGGQFIFFKTKKKSHFPGSILYKHCTDRKKIGDTILIISRGLGDTFPLRLNCPKEIVRITIE
jgi:uncharacterized protein